MDSSNNLSQFVLVFKKIFVAPFQLLAALLCFLKDPVKVGNSYSDNPHFIHTQPHNSKI